MAAASSPSSSSTPSSSSSVSASSSKRAESRASNLRRLQAWSGLASFDTDDETVATWYEDNRAVVQGKIEEMRAEGVAFDVAQLLARDQEGALKGVAQVLGMLPVEEKERVLKYLSQVLSLIHI